MSHCTCLVSQSHSFPTMPFTHVNSQTSQPISTNRNPALPGPERSPPAFQNIVLPVEDTTSIPRLKPNLYVTDQEAAIPQSLRMSPSMSTPPTARSSEPLPSIRDMVPELPARGTPLLVTSNQECGPDSFQPSGPIRRAAASGLAPASLSSSRISPYPTPEATPNGAGISDRNYSNSAPSGSRSTTSRNSPIQQLSGPLAHRSEPVRALPPLNGTFGSSEASRAGSYAIPPGLSFEYLLKMPLTVDRGQDLAYTASQCSLARSLIGISPFSWYTFRVIWICTWTSLTEPITALRTI